MALFGEAWEVWLCWRKHSHRRQASRFQESQAVPGFPLLLPVYGLRCELSASVPVTVSAAYCLLPRYSTTVYPFPSGSHINPSFHKLSWSCCFTAEIETLKWSPRNTDCDWPGLGPGTSGFPALSQERREEYSKRRLAAVILGFESELQKAAAQTTMRSRRPGPYPQDGWNDQSKLAC